MEREHAHKFFAGDPQEKKKNSGHVLLFFSFCSGYICIRVKYKSIYDIYFVLVACAAARQPKVCCAPLSSTFIFCFNKDPFPGVCVCVCVCVGIQSNNNKEEEDRRSFFGLLARASYFQS
jgi:hypothetical protein